jgi:hypothetical protein
MIVVDSWGTIRIIKSRGVLLGKNVLDVGTKPSRNEANVLTKNQVTIK